VTVAKKIKDDPDDNGRRFGFKKGEYVAHWQKPEQLEIITHLCRMGLTKVKLAEQMDITVPTLNAWIVRYPKIAEAIKAGFTSMQTEIDNALYKRARGFWFEEKSVVHKSDGSTETKITDKYIAPDPATLKYVKTCTGGPEWNERIVVDAKVTADMTIQDHNINTIFPAIAALLEKAGVPVSDLENALKEVTDESNTR